MTDTTKKAEAFTAYGSTGLQHAGGYIQEEYLNELSGDRWWKTIQEMTNDPTVAGILFAIQMLIRQTPLTVTPFSEDEADAEIAAFVDSCLHDMRDTLAMTLAEVLSFLPWGYAPLEVVYKIRGGEVRRDDGSPNLLQSSKHDDGRAGWACWSIRSQDTIWQWDFADDGEAIAFFQTAPPFYQTVRIPLSKCLHFRASSRKANPEGVSIFRAAYRPYYFKRRIENIEGIGIERDLAGLPVAYVPASLLSSERTAAETAAYTAIKGIVTNIRRDEQEGVLWPGDRDDKGQRQYELTLLSTGGTRQFDTGAIVERYDSRIAMSVLADFILIGHQQVGSYSLVSSKTSLFATALGAWLDTICEIISARIPELLRFNGMDDARSPSVTHGDIEKVELAELGAFLTALTGAKAGQLFSGSAGPRMLTYLLEQAGIPAPTEEETTKDLEEEQQQKEAEAKQQADQLVAMQQQQAQPQQLPSPPTPSKPEEPAKEARERRKRVRPEDIDGMADDTVIAAAAELLKEIAA
jgi:hypothetical protein